ncbi:major facilitator superfamily domain-containing protein [Truncatella angustata]|uniref:Major facilitator superfamily domain-containing protein n=1 Tax=Truncatella angustata TaxID=152316 RepID=A0A9P8UJ81_9PEZI|nr:major facilitator superfamily domain-containing protein [Truncatella angustata]KAH6653114.1 major facilitator superfamily domain-containing protein [Truncatella angustata]
MSTQQPKSDSEKEPRTAGEDEILEPHVHLKTYIAVFAVCVGFVAQNFAITGAGAQAQAIGEQFHSTDTAWTTGTLVIFCVVLGPIISQCADYWGRKPFLITLNLVGIAGSLIVARAKDMTMIIAGFCIIGLPFGAQGLIHAVASEVIPRRWRSWGQAAALVSTEVGLVLGLILSGALGRNGKADGFRNFYYITAGLFLLCTILCVVAYHPPPTKQQFEVTGFRAKLARLDWVGFFLLAGSLVLFCVALNWSQNPYPWSDPHVSALFALSIVLAAVMGLYEWRKPDGLFHHGLFQNRMYPICLICVFGEGTAFFAANAYLPYQISTLYEEDLLFVTLRLAIGFMAAAALFIFVAFFAGMAGATKNDESGGTTWGLPVLLGWAFGMVMVTLVTAAQLCVPPSLITIASCLMLSVRALGGTMGFAIYQAVFQSALSQLHTNIGEALVSAGLPRAAIPDVLPAITAQNTTGLLTLQGVTPEIVEAGTSALRATYRSGFHNVWATAAGFVSFAAVVSMFMFDPSSEFNYHIDAPVEAEEALYSKEP